MVRFARHLLEANISMKNVPERISKSFTTAVPQVYVLPPGSTAFENVNGRETPMDFSMDSRIPLTRSILQDVPISPVPGARGYPDVTFVLRKHYAPLTPAPSAPGPSVPGPSVPGPSVPGPSAPGLSAPGPSTLDPLTPSVALGPPVHSPPSALPPPNGPALQSIYHAVVAALKAAPMQSSHPAPVPGPSRITYDQLLADALSQASLDPERGEDIEDPVKALSRLSRPLRIESKLDEFLRVPVEFTPVITNPFPRLHPKPFENPIPFKEDRPLRVLAVDLPSHRIAFWKGAFPTWSVEVQLPQEDCDWVSKYWPSGIKIVKSLEEGQYVCQAWCWVRFHCVFVLVYNDRFTVTGRFGIKE